MNLDYRSPSLLQQSLAHIVTNDPRTADVFERLGLDYCCHGGRSLQEATAERGLPISSVVDDLIRLGEPAAGSSAHDAWRDLADLTHYIRTRHHGYVRSAQPRIAGWLDKLINRHGARHPELAEIRHVFDQLSADLFAHMMKEENILFPFIDTLAAAARSRAALPAGPFGTVANPIRAMEHDHEEAGALTERLRALTNGYQAPPDGCTTYQVCFQELAAFEADLHRHVHLENNVLFPRAIALEEELD
jgi:regulator of cell morphogenesis and NO signaling